MDIITHGLLGGALAHSLSRPASRYAAAGVGLVAALLPDLDVLIRSADDPLRVLEYHRQFSHSLLFTPIGALLAALISWPVIRRWLGFRAIYGFALAGYLSAVLLDACTSYGTQLFWPLSSQPVALSVIAVVDPVVTLTLLVALIGGLRLARTQFTQWGLLLVASYLLLGGVQHQRALSAAEQLAAERSQQPTRQLVKPTMANLLLWRVVTDVEGQVFLDGVHVGVRARTYEGESVGRVDPLRWQELPAGSRAYRDLNRFYTYTDGWLVAQGNYVGDIRYAMLPTGAEPLWGIVLEPDQPDGPVGFETRRTFTQDMRAQWLAMLMGRDLPE